MNQKIIEQARQNYPVGTIFQSITTKKTIEVVGTHFKTTDGGSNLLIDIGSVKNRTSNWYVYRDGKWATVLSGPTVSHELWI